MVIRLKVEKVNTAFATKKLVWVAGINLETGKRVKGYTISVKSKFIDTLKKAKEAKKYVVVSVTQQKDGFIFINPGNQEINEA